MVPPAPVDRATLVEDDVVTGTSVLSTDEELEVEDEEGVIMTLVLEGSVEVEAGAVTILVDENDWLVDVADVWLVTADDELAELVDDAVVEELVAELDEAEEVT